MNYCCEIVLVFVGTHWEEHMLIFWRKNIDILVEFFNYLEYIRFEKYC